MASPFDVLDEPETDLTEDEILCPQCGRAFDEASTEITPDKFLSTLRLSKDLREAAKTLSPQQQRIMVDLYYQIQGTRIATANQVRNAKQEPNEWITFMSQLLLRAEKLTAGSLEIASNQQAVSKWAKSNVGIGPVMASAFAAYIDIAKTPSVSALWSLAGMNPTAVWAKGTKRPWNAQLKVTCYKLGDSFCKFHNHPRCTYGHRYAARKKLEVERNEAGQFAELAKQTLEKVNIREPKTRATYEEGKLPDGRLELRARRVAVKLFLSHYWQVAWYEHYHTLPKPPYIQAKEGDVHTHYVPPLGYEHIFIWP